MIKMNMFKTVIRFLIVSIVLLLSDQTSFSQSPIPQSAVVEKLRTGFLQPEGPVWKDGVGLLFSDIQANKIYRWSPVDSSLVTYLNPSDSSNGLTFDKQGRLILTQMAKRRVARQELDGTITPLASLYNGKKFNSPNDLVVKSDGSIFFTDPDFNIPVGQTSELKFQGIYRIGPSGLITLLDKSLNKPNGICFSLDENKLFVNESAKDSIYVWDVVNDSTLANKRPFYKIPASGYADGMKVDADSNIYCTGPGGVWIVSPTGTGIGKISTSPDNPSNCAWGDADRNTLYITAKNSLYRMRMLATGVEKDPVRPSLNQFELLQNYPNPFNPSTNFEYRISRRGMVSLIIYDVLGRQVALLVNEEQSSGYYHAQWETKGIAAGMYYARLIEQDAHGGVFQKSKKMLLIQ
jgi:gluconolactonase